MRKLSLFIIAVGATLGVAAAQADETVDTAPEVVPYLPPEPTGEEPEVHVDPMVEVAEEGTAVTFEATGSDDGAAVEYPVVTSEDSEANDSGITDDSSMADSSGATDDSGTTDDSVADDSGTDDSGTTDDPDYMESLPPKEESGTVTDDQVVYITTSTGTDTGIRGTEGCMECRNLTGMSNDTAAEAPAPEVMADVLDGNATGVDVMDPAEAKKRK